ncbi:diguanylate cyclase domain-containing protein [Anaerolentibacter hominis]|uniref:diguanylate cyclase domain-containing protein n=1 Tax=Anaerolentibacter hominis TaxID=3079009 RepID=UPI0031B89EAC
MGEEGLCSDQNLKTLTEHIPGGIFRCLFDEPLTILQMSDSFLTMFGYTAEEIKERFGNSFWRMIDDRDKDAVLADVISQLKKGNTKEIEYRVTCKNGETIWVLDNGQLLRDEDGRESFYCVLVDITRQKEDREALRLSLERHQIIMDQSNDVIFEWDIKNDIAHFSNNWEKKFGYAPLTDGFRAHISEQSHIHPNDQQEFMSLLDGIAGGRNYGECTVRFYYKEQNYIWCRIRMTAQYDKAGGIIKAVGVIVDVDDEKRQQQRLMEKAQKDTLTKFYNKGTAHHLIQKYLESDNPGVSNAVFIVDIDDFKQINDTMGHLYGDAFLVEIAGRIRRLFREGDILSRIGGDEFIILMKAIPDEKAVGEKAQELITIFREMAYGAGNNKKRASCSIGIAISPESGNDFVSLYRNADYALYQAKGEGKNCYRFYHAGMKKEIPNAPVRLRTALGAQIDSDEAGMGLNNKLVEYVFRILYKSIDLDAAIHSIFEIIGTQFDVSRVYIFENSEDDLTCSNTFEWCHEGIAPEMSNLQNVSYESDLGGNYIENFNEDGIFYCRDIRHLSKAQYEILAAQNIKSVLQCAIRDNGRMKGFVGFDECLTNRFWTQEQIDTLSFVAELLSTFLMKKRAQDRAEQNAEAMEMILDNQNSWIYVIRPDTYKMVYINRKTRELIPDAQVGMTCYKAYFGLDHPCENCPARELTAEKLSNTLEVYNPMLKVWSLADASRIVWKGSDAVLLCCHDITALKKKEKRQ